MLTLSHKIALMLSETEFVRHFLAEFETAWSNASVNGPQNARTAVVSNTDYAATEWLLVQLQEQEPRHWSRQTSEPTVERPRPPQI